MMTPPETSDTDSGETLQAASVGVKPSEQPRNPSPRPAPLESLGDTISETVEEMGRVGEVVSALLDSMSPGWEKNLTKDERLPLTDWYCYLSLAWVCAAGGVATDARLDETFTMVSRTSRAVEALSVGKATSGTMQFDAVPEGYPLPTVPVSPSVPWQREQVLGWMTKAAGWAETFVKAADLGDPTWEDHTVAADSPSATFVLRHLWQAWQRLVDYATGLGVADGDVPVYPTRAWVDKVRYGRSGAGGTEAGQPSREHNPGTDALWVRTERKKRRWSQTELGRRAGTGQGTVSGVETGRLDLTEQTLARFKEAFAASPVPDKRSPKTRSSTKIGHRHTWSPFVGADGFPALLRCDECGWSILTNITAATGLSLAPVEHTHEWETLFVDDGTLSVLRCLCGALIPVVLGDATLVNG